MRINPVVLGVLCLLVPTSSFPQARVDTLLGTFSEEWRDNWQEQKLADVGNDFRLSVDGEALRVRSENSASAIWREVEYSGRDRVSLSWRWKIDHTIPDNNRERERAGDDFPARLFVVFEGTPFSSRSKAICYVWAASEPVGAAFINPYLDNVATVVLQSGDERIGSWIGEERNVVEDFQALFRRTPSAVTGIALMVDTDNTGTDATAWFDDIAVFVYR